MECTLGHHYRKINEKGEVSGGPMYYLRDGLKELGYSRAGKILGAFSALTIIGGAVGSGALFQTNQATQQLANVLIPITGGEDSIFQGAKWILGLVYLSAAMLVIVGGIKHIVKVTERLVPTMATIYIAAALIILIANFGEIPGAFAAIFKGAFAPEGVAGGFIGVLIQGIRRASFSNEAGLGSAAIAHATAKTKEPVQEGLVALLEPFVDTVVVCTMTALVIIITGTHLTMGGTDGITMTSAAF